MKPDSTGSAEGRRATPGAPPQKPDARMPGRPWRHSDAGGPMLSVITTAHNEVGSVDPFLQATLRALGALGVSAEVLYFDDGSTDGTAEAVCAFRDGHPEVPIRLIRRESRLGITASMEEAFSLAGGELLCLLPADLESDPELDIPALVAAMDGETDVVVGWRKERADGKLLASKLYNGLNRLFFGLRLHDANWIKLVRRDKVQGIRLRSDWHRFLLAILAHRGCRIREVETRWHPRRFGRSHFGLRRFPVSLADLVTVRLLLSFGERPLLLCGTCGAVSLLLACLMLALLLWDAAPAPAPRLALAAGVVLFGVSGLVGFALGAVAEILVGMEGARVSERRHRARADTL